MPKTLEKQGDHFVEIEVTPASPNFKKSLFSDEQGEGLYHATVKLEGYNVYVREMSSAELEAYIAAESALEKRARAASGKVGPEISDAVRRQVEAETRAVLAEQEKLAVSLLQAAIVGWDVPREFNAESLSKLTKQARNKLMGSVVRTAGLGQSESDFLETTS